MLTLKILRIPLNFRMKKFALPCPEVQVLKKHVLVMTFIGEDQKPAPKLKDARLPVEDWEIAYQQVLQVNLVKLMHRQNT